jgi:hypothetical protein
MTKQRSILAPAPSTVTFQNGIVHPDLWLWDVWTVKDGDELRLYTLAINKVDAQGRNTSPKTRNDYPFHIRHFVSADKGESWRDLGVFFAPSQGGDGGYSRNIWSGSMHRVHGRNFVCGFTGIREQDEARPFLQAIYLANSESPSELAFPPQTALSCPSRDFDLICEQGYYLGPRETLGTAQGEEGGPILSWRDPFVYAEGNDVFEVFWAAKVRPTQAAVAHATVRRAGTGFEIQTLHPPMSLPDGNLFTQAEVPKIYKDERTGLYFLLISACTRISEVQPESEVAKDLRLYVGPTFRGPWTGAFAGGDSMIEGVDCLFGGTIEDVDTSTGRLKLLSAFTESHSEALQLTVAPLRTVCIDPALPSNVKVLDQPATVG